MFAFGEVMNILKSDNSELYNILSESQYIMCTTNSIDELNHTYFAWINRLTNLCSKYSISHVATANDIFMKTYLSNRKRLAPENRAYELMNILFDAMPSTLPLDGTR